MAVKPIEILIRARDEASSIFTGVQAKVLAVTAAVASFLGFSMFAGAVRSAAEFEAAMSRVKAASGAAGAELKGLRQAAQDAGANTKYTSVEAAQALENLAKAGLDAKDAIAALPAVLALAQAGDIELGQSAEFTTKAVMGFNLAFTESGRVADVLAKGANASNTSVVGLAQALSYAAPVANSLGVSLETTVAILGKFADAGIDASRGGTALNSILSQFSDPASKFRQELGAAGIVTTNFEQALRELAAAGPRGQKAINAVGMEAGPALRALLGQGIGALDDLKRKLDEAGGSAAATAAVMENNLQGAANGLTSAWDTVKTVLGTPVLPVLKDAVDQLAGALRGAVADGTVGRFGEAMASAFQSGIKWGRDFLAQINFTQIATDMRAFADRANEVFTQIGEYASNAGNSVRLAYGVMSAGVNAVLTAVFGIGSVFAEVASKVMTGVAMLREGLASVTFGTLSDSFKLAAEDARNAAQGFAEAAQAMREKSAQALQDTADAAQTARNGFEGLAQSVSAAKPVVDASSQAIAEMARQIEEAGAKTAVAAKTTQDKTAVDTAAVSALRQLRAEYSELVASGSLQGAAEKLQEINKIMSAAPGAAKGAEEAAARVEQAYRNLGMKTTQELTEAAELGRQSFESLTTAGVASANTLRQAFEVYARAEIEAAERQGAAALATTQRMLATKAAASGLTLEIDTSGKATVAARDSSVKATKEMADGWSGVGSAARGAGRAAAEAAEANQKALEKIYARYGQSEEERKARYGEVGEMESNVGESRDTRFVGMLQSDINQMIAERYGEDMVGNDKAEEALKRNMELENYQRGYGDVRRSQESLNQERNIRAERDRLERELEAERQGKKASGTSAMERIPSAQPTGDDSNRGGGSSNRGGGIGGGTTTTTYVSNITIPGMGSAQFGFSDPTQQQQGTDLLRRLAKAKRTAIR